MASGVERQRERSAGTPTNKKAGGDVNLAVESPPDVMVTVWESPH